MNDKPSALVPIRKAGVVAGHAIIDAEDLPLIAGYRFRFDVEGYVIGSKGQMSPKALHRLVMREPPGIVDHIHGVLTDCRKSKLRVTSRAGNSQHRVKLCRNNTSGYRGVTWKKRAQKWEARAEHMGKQYFGGFFDDPLEANEAACKLRERLGFLTSKTPET